MFPGERFLGAFFCFLWNEMLRTLPTSKKITTESNTKKECIMQPTKLKTEKCLNICFTRIPIFGQRSHHKSLPSQQLEEIWKEGI